ncbi:MAG: NAD-dependent epimerase/dehydratase family protein [Myxococcota bacterium]
MRILVTGGTGFIGSHTVRALRAAGHDVRLLVRDERKARRLWRDDPPVLEDLVVGSLTSAPDTARALRECEGLVHTAAPVALAASAREARRVARDNVLAIRRLVERGLEGGMTRIVHLSSTTIFDTRGLERADATTPIIEDGDAYAASKVAAERHVRALQDAGAPIAITYPPGVIGPDDPGLSEGVKGVQMLIRDGVAVTSSGLQNVDVRDVAAVHVALIERAPAPGRFVTAAEYLPWAKFADLLDQATGIRVPRYGLPGGAIRLAGRVGDQLRRYVGLEIDPIVSTEASRFATQWVEFDASETTRALGVPFRPAKESLYDTVRWLAEQGHVDPARAPRFTHPGRGRR